MTQSRWLVVGASGLVGTEVARAASTGDAQVLGVARTAQGLATQAMDLADRAQVERTVGDFAPTSVAICSAWPHVDGCEKEPERSHRENVETVQTLLSALSPQTSVLFFSTDHVFDGKRNPNAESDPVNPPSVYARHKREVEELLLERGHALIARTAWVFGVEQRKKNFVYRVIDCAQKGERLKVPLGQAGTPTWSVWLAESSVALLNEGLRGVVHLSGERAFTKAEWARTIVESLMLPPLAIEELTPEQAGQVAPRPDRVVMRTTRHARVPPPPQSVLSSLRERFTSR